MRTWGVAIAGWVTVLAIAQSPQLEPGKSVERKIAPAEIQLYEIPVQAGQFLRIHLETNGLHLTATLRQPGGQPPLVVADAAPYDVPVTLSAAPSEAGTCRIEVRLPGQAPPGSYEIEVSELRTVSPADGQRIQAERALHEGMALRAKKSGTARREAAAKFQQASSLSRAAGDRHGEAAALNLLGGVYYLLGESREAIDAYAQVLAIVRETGQRDWEAGALNNIGLEYSNLGDYPKALEYLQNALKLNRQVGKNHVPVQLNTIALTYYRMGDTENALQYYNQALELRRQNGDKNGEAYTLTGIGATAALRGEYQKAIDCSKRAAELWHGLGNSQMEAHAITNIGGLYGRLGDHRLALDYLMRALPARQYAGDRPGEAVTLLNLGLQHLALGDTSKALKFFAEARPIWVTLGNRPAEANVLAAIGDAHLKSGNLADAFEQHSLAQSIARTAGDRALEARSTSAISAIHLRRGELPQAAASAEEALAIARAGGLRNEEQVALAASARAESALGNLDRARERIQGAIELAESARGSVAGSDLRSIYFSFVRPEYDLLIDILMRLHRRYPAAGHDAEAFAVSERSRARGLLDLLGESRADIREGIDPELLARERSLRATLQVKANAPEQAVQTLIADYRELENQIRARSPRYASLTRPEPVGIAAMREQLLDADTALIEYSLGEERGYVWLVTREAIASAELPARAIVEAAARKAYESLSTNGASPNPESVRALSRMVLGPVAANLTKKRLAVVTEGALQYIPFGALEVASGEALIARHVVVGLPSVSTLAMLRQEEAGRLRASKRVIVLGDPVFDADDPRVTLSAHAAPRPEADLLTRSATESGMARFERLKFTRLEAESIVALAGKSPSREAVDFDASRQTATSGELADYRIVHLATHALLNNRHPEFSGLVLSLVDRAGHPVDGFLRAYEVYNLRLRADLVVLSACRTALGEDVRGEGLMGLTRGFMYAGAPRVVASLWSVPDRGTAELMRRFYAGMLAKGLRPADALRAAQLAMRNDPRWRAPYHWAGFVLQGEWN